MKAGKLTFKPLDVTGKQSIAADLTDEEARGIYAYEFTDETWYIGKAKDVRNRHIQHLHEYKHKEPPLVIKSMLWANLPNSSDAELDYSETSAISWFEKQGYSLRNVMKTERPLGNTEVVVDTHAGWGIAIPWERENIPPSTREFTFEEDEGRKARFEKLKRRSDYPQILHVLRQYVSATIPSPADSGGILWSLTALPQTNSNSRYCTLSCNITETFVIYKGAPDGQPGCFINVKETEDHLSSKWDKFRLERYGSEYRRLPNCSVLDFNSLDEVEHFLQDETALDCCYRATAELMRRGPGPFGKRNNGDFMQAVLTAIENEEEQEIVQTPDVTQSEEAAPSLEQPKSTQAFNTVFAAALKLPYVKVNRDQFLRKNLSKDGMDKKVVDRAINTTPLQAGIPPEQLEKIVSDVISRESLKTTGVSAFTGIFGGTAMVGAIPADLSQYLAHTLRIAQEVAYLYGWEDFIGSNNHLDDDERDALILFLGIMSGQEDATEAVKQIAGDEMATRITARVFAETAPEAIVKEVAAFLGREISEETVSKVAGKAVPVLGSFISGGMTLATFRPMCTRLQESLRTVAK